VQKLRRMVGAWLRFMALLLTGRVGLLHVHLSSRASFWRKLAFVAPALWAGRKVLLHLHGSEFAVFYERECSPARQRVVRWVFNRSARVVVLSDAWAAWTRTITANPGLRVLYNPVVQAPQAASTDQGKPMAPCRLLFLGRMGERKGTFDLLKAVAQARAQGADVQLALGGDGDRAGVKALAATLGITPQVELLGWVRGEDKQRQLAQASVFVLPSYHEGLPMGILEAMAAGLPVLSTPVGGIPEAVSEGVEGHLVAPGDVAALAARLVQLAADPALAARMGQAAREKVARCFAADVIVPQVEALYDEVLAS
jgi:glycosyltransferase involved in cell wall biosynthesis